MEKEKNEEREDQLRETKKGKKEWRFKGKLFQESAELWRFKMALYEENQANLIYQ